MARNRDDLKLLPTSVYLIVSGDHVKIGLAVDPQKRLKNMISGMAERPHLFATRVFPDRITAQAIERKMHRKFYYRKSRGEWFQISAKEAWAALKHMRVPSREHMMSGGGAGWSAPDTEEVREAMNRVWYPSKGELML